MNAGINGFIDLQVNGYAGLDFNSEAYNEGDLVALCERLRRDGVKQILPTIITASLTKMVARVEHLVGLVDSNPQLAEMIAGIHVEGPFISPVPGYVGAHPVADVVPASVDVAARLLDVGRGFVKLWTLAPEQDANAKVTQWLSDRGVVVAAGHSNASLEQLQQGIDHGIKLFTHLGNGCPAVLPRHDNIIQRVLALSDQLSISFIADGHHVPPFALANYLRVVPEHRVVIVTDAISAAGLGPGRYQLSDQTVEVDVAGAAWSADRSHFAGSAATMPVMIGVLREMGFNESQLTKWTCEHPARLLKPA